MLVEELYSDAKDILGRCDQAKVFDRITEAIRLLANKGEWNPLIGLVDITSGTDKRTITLPKDIDTPLAVNVGGQPMYFRNQWHEFHLNGSGSCQETSWTWDDSGFVSTFMDIKQSATLVAVANLKNDLGSTVQVFGYDEKGLWIRSQQPDGTWLDGYKLPVNVLSDFPSGIITENPYRFFSREMATVPITELHSSAAHQFLSGAQGTVSLVSAPLPTPLITGTGYFIRSESSDSISLHATRESALSGVSPIQITSAGVGSVISLNDKRQVEPQTLFHSAQTLNFQQAAPVQFTGAPLPSPITGTEVFYAHVIDGNNFTIHSSADDATNNVNPLFVTTAGASVKALANQGIAPYTHLVFSVDHNFIQGDAVTVSSAGGTLPNPLLPGITYFVRYVDSKTVTLHSSLAESATGQNPIILTTAGQGAITVVKLIAASINVGSINNIVAPNHNLGVGDLVQFQSSGAMPEGIDSNTVYKVQTPLGTNSFTLSNTSFSTATTVTRRRSDNTALLVTSAPHGLVTGNTVDISGLGGSGYNKNQAEITVVDPSAFTYTDVGADEGVVNASTRCRTTNVAYIQTGVNHGLTTGDYVNIQGLGGVNYDQDYVQVTVLDSLTFKYNNVGINDGGAGSASVARSANVATVVTALSHGFNTGDIVNILGLGGGYDVDNVTITVTNSTTFTYSNVGANQSTTANVNGYIAKGIVDPNGKIAKGVADALGTVYYGRVGITTSGTGQLYLIVSRAFTIGFTNQWFADTTNLTTGTPFYLSTTGVFPVCVPTLSPLTQYYARVIDAFTLEVYPSAAIAADTAVRTSATRQRTANVATLTTSTNHGFTTGDYVNVIGLGGADYNANNVQVTVVNATTFTYSDVGADEGSTADVNGRIAFSPVNVNQIGSGTMTLVLQRSVTVGFINSNLAVGSNAYLSADGTAVQFTTDGTLPSPLQVNTTYTVKPSDDGGVAVYDSLGAQITIASVGTGTHYLNHLVNFSVQLPTSYEVDKNEYLDGEAVSFQSESAPPPLVSGTTYYVRRIDNDLIELYDTAAHAMDTTNTTGRLVAIQSGRGTLNQMLAAPKFSRVERVVLDPAPRNGFIDVYAWDLGRQDRFTVIGHYYPEEKEPQYRRIKTLLSCQWIRMRYRRKTYAVTSQNDYIPLNSKTAILMMLRAMELYRTNYTDEGAKYEGLAVKFLKEEHAAHTGPEAIQIQFNDAVMQDSSSMWMD